MTLPENKIVVQDVTEKIDNPREKMYNQRIKKKTIYFQRLQNRIRQNKRYNKK